MEIIHMKNVLLGILLKIYSTNIPLEHLQYLTITSKILSKHWIIFLIREKNQQHHLLEIYLKFISRYMVNIDKPMVINY